MLRLSSAELEYRVAAAVAAEPGMLVVGPGFERLAVAKLLLLHGFRSPASGESTPKLGWDVQVGLLTGWSAAVPVNSKCSHVNGFVMLVNLD